MTLFSIETVAVGISLLAAAVSWYQAIEARNSRRAAEQQAHSAKRQVELATEQANAARVQAHAAREQVLAAQKANAIAQAALDAQERERAEREMQRISVFPEEEEGSSTRILIQNDGPHAFKVTEMRIVGAGWQDPIHVPADQWLSHVTYQGRGHYRVGKPDVLVGYGSSFVEGKRFAVSMRIVIEGAYWTLVFTGTRHWDGLRLSTPELINGWIPVPLLPDQSQPS